MLRTLSPLFLSLFCGILCAADPLPVGAQKAMDKAITDIAKVRMVLVKDLTKEQEIATKKGDLDGAMAIKAEIERQTKEVEGAADLLGKPKAPISTSKRVVLYAMPNFKGPSYTVAASETDVVLDVHAVGFPNDALRSLRLPPGYTLTVYAAERAGGDSFVVSEESADLTETPAFKLGMSSFMVSKPK